MRRLLVVWLFAAVVASCQCFTPVSEDGGTGGGTGGGGTGGGGTGGGTGGGGTSPECTHAADCTPLDAGFPFCSGEPEASCINQRCVTECEGGRACTRDTGTCLVCTEPVSTRCAPSVCSAVFSCTWTIGGSTCPRGPVNGRQWTGTRQPDCSWVMTDADGGVVGHRWDLDPGDSFGEFVGVDGLCVGKDLFTGLARMQWSCPDGCLFLEEGCD